MTETIRQSSAPTAKVLAATGGSTVAAAVATLALWGLRSVNLEMPEEVELAITTLIVAAVTFLAGYQMPPGSSETVMVDRSGVAVSARFVQVANEAKGDH